MKPRIALVVGANGGLGGEVTRALLRRGWQVRGLVRNKPRDENGSHHETGELKHRNFEWHAGDALCRDDVLSAAHQAAVIVHAVNPAKYHNWRGLALPMLDNTIAAADANGSRIVFPGTLYNYGRDSFPLIDEFAPQHPHTRKGAIRVEMEERLRDACWDGRARALIVRAGDFFGPRAGSSWFSQGIVMPRQPVRLLMNPGERSLQHSWGYLPDVAETIVRLLEHEASLAKFESFHFKGHWIGNGELLNQICDTAGISRRRVLRFPWSLIHATAPLVELSREMAEMRYLWNEAVELDNRKLVERLGAEPHTPIEHAVRATLVGMGCLTESSHTQATAGTY